MGLEHSAAGSRDESLLSRQLLTVLQQGISVNFLHLHGRLISALLAVPRSCTKPPVRNNTNALAPCFMEEWISLTTATCRVRVVRIREPLPDLIKTNLSKVLAF